MAVKRTKCPRAMGSLPRSRCNRRKSLETLFEWFDNEIGKIDCLVHAAGINIALQLMQELEPANWDQLIGINLTGTYNVLR